jgi:hypothetical protein
MQKFRDTSRRLNGLSSSLEEEAIDARVAKAFAGLEKKSMPNTFDVTDEREAVGGEEGAGQQLNQILAVGLPPSYVLKRLRHMGPVFLLPVVLDRVIGSLDSLDLFDSQRGYPA